MAPQSKQSAAASSHEAFLSNIYEAIDTKRDNLFQRMQEACEAHFLDQLKPGASKKAEKEAKNSALQAFRKFEERVLSSQLGNLDWFEVDIKYHLAGLDSQNRNDQGALEDIVQHHQPAGYSGTSNLPKTASGPSINKRQAKEEEPRELQRQKRRKTDVLRSMQSGPGSTHKNRATLKKGSQRASDPVNQKASQGSRGKKPSKHHVAETADVDDDDASQSVSGHSSEGDDDAIPSIHDNDDDENNDADSEDSLDADEANVDVEGAENDFAESHHGGAAAEEPGANAEEESEEELVAYDSDEDVWVRLPGQSEYEGNNGHYAKFQQLHDLPAAVRQRMNQSIAKRQSKVNDKDPLWYKPQHKLYKNIMCVRKRDSRHKAELPGKSACAECMERGWACLQYQNGEERAWFAPLHQKYRDGADPMTERYWILPDDWRGVIRLNNRTDSLGLTGLDEWLEKERAKGNGKEKGKKGGK